MLQDVGYLVAKPTSFPMKQNLKISRHDGDLLHDPTVFIRLIGHILYLNITQPDLSFSVHRLSQYMDRPQQPHLQAAYHILQYVKHSPGYGLCFPTQNDF